MILRQRGKVDTEITQADLQYEMKYFNLACQIFHVVLGTSKAI